MKTNVTTVLENCTSIKKDASIEPRIIIQLLATSLCLMLSESVGMAKDLFKIIPAGIPQKGAQKIACERLELAETRAKEQFKHFVSSLIINAKECEKVISAFNADINSII